MTYSTIKRKYCKCDVECTRMPTIGYSGYYAPHAPEEVKEKKELQRAETRKRSNARKADSIKLRSLARKTNGESEMELWFKARRQDMTGFCAECGAKSFKNHPTQFTWSIAHIVPKSLCPSVSTHYLNFIELCWLHHQEFDSTFDKASKMLVFAEAKSKFSEFKHLLPKEELRKVNPFLL